MPRPPAPRLKRPRAPRRRPQPGATPGTLAVAQHTDHAPIRVIRFSADSFLEERVASASECAKYLQEPGICWFDLDDAPDGETLEAFRSLLGAHCVRQHPPPSRTRLHV